MNNSSRPGYPHRVWGPHSIDPHPATSNDTEQARANVLHKQAAVIYKIWSFGIAQQAGRQPRPTLMRANPSNRRPLLALRRKPILLRRRVGQAPINNLDDENELEDYKLSETEHRLSQPAQTSSSFHSKQDQQGQGNLGGQADDEKHRELDVGPARLRLAKAKPKTTFALLVPNEDLPPFQNINDALAYFTQAIFQARDKSLANLGGFKLRPSVQELILCLLSNLRLYGTVPMTKLDSVRQYLIEAVLTHKKNSQGRGQGQDRGQAEKEDEEKEEEEEEEEEEQEEEKEKGKKEKNQANEKSAEIGLPEAVKDLNLLLPVIVLSSQRPSTSEQLKLAYGRAKAIIRTALK